MYLFIQLFPKSNSLDQMWPDCVGPSRGHLPSGNQRSSKPDGLRRLQDIQVRRCVLILLLRWPKRDKLNTVSGPTGPGLFGDKVERIWAFPLHVPKESSWIFFFKFSSCIKWNMNNCRGRSFIFSNDSVAPVCGGFVFPQCLSLKFNFFRCSERSSSLFMCRFTTWLACAHSVVHVMRGQVWAGSKVTAACFLTMFLFSDLFLTSSCSSL